MSFINTLSFLNPWLLVALITLPILIYVLRMLPPPPKDVTLATTHFLERLKTQKRTSSKTPWWILVLRMLILTCFILAFAHPVLQPKQKLQINNPVLLVIDNSWASAQNWSQMMVTAQFIANDAVQRNLPITMALTTPAFGQDTPQLFSSESGLSLPARLKGLTPQPYESENGKLAQLIKKSSALDKDMDVVFVSSGIQGRNSHALINAISSFENLNIFTPADKLLPTILSENQNSGKYLLERIAPDISSQNATVLALNSKNKILAQHNIAFEGNALTLSKDIESGNKDISPARLKIAGQNHVASVLLKTGTSEQQKVGIATKGETEKDANLAQGSYYLSKAISPFADVSFNTPQDLIKNMKSFSVVIFPDVATLDLKQLDDLQNWIKKGGILLRFSGESMAQRDQLPVATKMQLGVRSLGGDITWEDAPTLEGFPENSPLYGLEIRDMLTIRKQLLADPAHLDKKYVWAHLSDETPFITARAIGKGFVSVIHTSADPAWSDFPLTGLYVDILKTIIELAERPALAFDNKGTTQGIFKPIALLDGFGNLSDDIATLQGVSGFPLSEKDIFTPSALTPPGLYEFQGKQFGLNLGQRLINFKPIRALTKTSNITVMNDVARQDFKPFLLKLAIFLFLIDWVAMVYLMRFSGRQKFKKTAAKAIGAFIAFIALSFATPQAMAQSDVSKLNLIENLHFAYVQSDNQNTNRISQRGLENLASLLIARTSVEPVGVVPLNLETDDPLFFPFLYWKVDSTLQPLSSKAKTRLQNYMNSGGLVLVDFNTPSALNFNSTEMQSFLETLEGVSLPSLKPLDEKHALTRSFYLLDTLYGTQSSSPIWVGYDEQSGEASVAPFILGGNDWGNAWATGTDDLAMRAGVNITMYALTGNYKTDQLHLKTILERLGQ